MIPFRGTSCVYHAFHLIAMPWQLNHTGFSDRSHVYFCCIHASVIPESQFNPNLSLWCILDHYSQFTKAAKSMQAVLSSTVP